MYIDFDGHHSGGNSFDMYMIFGLCYKMWAIPTGTSSALKKKSLSIWSRTLNSVWIRQSGRTGNRGAIRDVLRTPGKSPGKWRGHNGPLYPTCLKLLLPC